jgi:ketosteroid isomerase-like protein
MVTRILTRACSGAGLAALLAACTTVPEQQPVAESAPDVQVILDLETRFAAASRERGARTAFLEFLAEDSIVLQPGPVWGRAAWESSEEIAGTLDWSPDWAELAGDGSLGFATGPWSLAPAGEGSQVEGRYLTVWRRGSAGWAVVFDGGFGRRPNGTQDHPRPETAAAACEPGPAILPGELQVRDLSLSGSAPRPHGAKVLERLAGSAVLFHPPAVEGLRERPAQQAALDALPAATQLWPMGAGIASSGDLGYTYGLSAPGADEAADASYAHLWCRLGGEWRLLLELRTRLPSS